MTWRSVHASTAGTSHIATGRECDDDCWASVEQPPQRLPHLCVFVADGAGSALRGGDGARLAIQAAVAHVEQQLSAGDIAPEDHFALGCITAVRRSVFEAADASALRPRDFACTFLGLISSDLGTLAFQVGDGGIVVDMGSGLEAPIKPMQGEFANMTSFVTDDNAESQLQTHTFALPVTRAAVFSDGLQRLALNMSTNVPFEPFFAKLFAVLASSRPEQEDQLQAAMVQFLNSPAVNERTDDDKSLALAIMPA